MWEYMYHVSGRASFGGGAHRASVETPVARVMRASKDKDAAAAAAAAAEEPEPTPPPRTKYAIFSPVWAGISQVRPFCKT